MKAQSLYMVKKIGDDIFSVSGNDHNNIYFY